MNILQLVFYWTKDAWELLKASEELRCATKPSTERTVSAIGQW